MIITKTPYRISFFGGGTDHPEWYREHGGRVLSTTFDKYCYNLEVSETIPRSSFINSKVNNKYLKIFVSRLIGIEGVMAVQSLDNKGYDLIKASLKEKISSNNKISFFDIQSKSINI